MASDMRDRFAWTTRSRQSIWPRRQCSGFPASYQPPDPDEHVDRAYITFGDERCLHDLFESLGEPLSVVRVHCFRTPVPDRGAAPCASPVQSSSIEHREIFKVLLTLFQRRVKAGLAPCFGLGHRTGRADRSPAPSAK
jgi:hypothetical protein